uniref:EGF-like domain-containing protein n=1 Tax=Meloidogyne floridensis TaxID=298350 RepID=A0A915NH59_9BILA
LNYISKGFISVDSLRTEFSCPGISANLDIDEPIFLGAVPWPDLFSFDQEKENNHQVEAVTVIEMGEPLEMKRNFPSSVIKFILIPNWAVWTINLRQGFFGCMKNIRLNGINIEIAHMFQSTKLLQTERPTERSLSSKTNKSISFGCPFSFVDFCKKPGSKNPCKNGGICSSYHNSFHCDCSDTPFDGINCQQKPRPLPFPLPESLSAKFHFSDSWQLEAENLEIKFRPKLGITLNELNKQKKLFVLIDTKSDINEKDEDKQRLLVAITGSGGLIVHW